MNWILILVGVIVLVAIWFATPRADRRWITLLCTVYFLGSIVLAVWANSP
jgi:hypothetical protein